LAQADVEYVRCGGCVGTIDATDVAEQRVRMMALTLIIQATGFEVAGCDLKIT